MPAEFIQHRSPQTNKAKAPYNFVPLPEKVLIVEEEFAAHDKYNSDRHTGYIELDIKTETPLYTRCAYPSDIFSAEKIYVDDEGNLKREFSEGDKPKTMAIPELQQFFHRGDAQIPVIPGSTLRGMTRSLVEILAYGKMNFVTNKQLVYRSVAQTFYRENFSKMNSGALDYPVSSLKAGYLEVINGEYYIRPALQDSDGNSFVRVEYDKFELLEPNWEEHRVYDDFFVQPPAGKLERMSSSGRIRLRFVISNRIERTSFTGSQKVSIVCSGHMTGQTEKHMHYAVYEPNRLLTQSQTISIDKKLWKVYKEDIELSRGIEPRELENGKPVFYLVNGSGNLVFFGPTMMFRLPYTNNTEDFIPENLRCSNTLDFAEAIFGKVDENSKQAIASRVFFSDAVWNPTNTTESPFLGGANDGRRVPKNLSSPKPTSFQLYLAQPAPNHSNDLKSYNDLDKTVIRGSKRYWHKKNAQESSFFANSDTTRFNPNGVGVQERKMRNNGSYENWKESKQHTIIKPVKPNVKFGNSKVYFENLTSIELGALLTSLDLENTMRHQIGMAKPYGLGSIEIKPTLVLQDRESRYQSLFDENNAWSNPPKTTSEDFKLLFKENILTHYNDLVSQTSKVNNFWQIPRLQSLATMLEFTNTGNFELKKYADFQQNREMFTRRHVLPYPQNVENNREPNQIQLNNPNLWAENCVDENGEENENQLEIESQVLPIVTQNLPSVPSTLINLPPMKVSNELHQYYQKWEKLEDVEFKVAYGKVILEKGKHWKKSQEKTWFQEVFNFVEKNERNISQHLSHY